MSDSALTSKRIRQLVSVCGAIFLLFGLRLIDVQAVQAGGYTARANNELLNSSVLLAPRGTITDINGVQLARSVAAVNIVVDQVQIADPAKTAAFVAPYLSMRESDLLPLLTGTKRYQIIAKQVTPEIWNTLNAALTAYNTKIVKEPGGLAARLLGFYSERSYVRDYPTGTLAASLIGKINEAGVGAGGLESSLDSTLTGTNGRYLFANGAGTIIPGSQEIVTASKAGTGVELTIDRDVQWVAQDAISAAVKKAHAVSGTVVVMDPKTGQILAQASAPTFDPTKPIKDISVLRNPAVTDAYEPGSVGKIITYSAAMEEGKITPLTTLTIPYTLKVGGTPFHDHEKHPTEVMTTTGALAISSNTGAIQVGEMISNDTLYSYLQKFGIGQLTGSHLPGETQGILHPVSTWSATSAPTIAFGQGYSVTALQATSVFATIANGGVRVTPNVVAGYFDPSGNFTPSKPSLSTRVVSEETATKMRLMMESVVTADGTAPEAAIPGYRVAGKTGTAMRANGMGGYSGYTASFIGFAPADAPRYVVSVVVQAPQGQHFGGVVAGPVFKQVMSFVLQAKHIAPTPPSKISYPLTEAALKASGAVMVTTTQTIAGKGKNATP
jgi:cell division protein FtsI (penicillin-binding protein 3)